MKGGKGDTKERRQAREAGARKGKERGRGGLLLADKDAGEAHAATDAHARHKHLAPGPLGDAEPGRDLPGAGRSEWVAEGDGPAVEIDAVKGQAERLDRVDGLRGKGLVNLVEVDLVLGQAGQLERLGNCNRWADALDVRHTRGRKGGG
jgi:hypothetical protein